MSKFFLVICIFFALSEIGFLFFNLSFVDHEREESDDTKLDEINIASIIIILCCISGIIKLILTCHFILKTNGNFHFGIIIIFFLIFSLVYEFLLCVCVCACACTYNNSNLSSFIQYLLIHFSTSYQK